MRMSPPAEGPETSSAAPTRATVWPVTSMRPPSAPVAPRVPEIDTAPPPTMLMAPPFWLASLLLPAASMAADEPSVMEPLGPADRVMFPSTPLTLSARSEPETFTACCTAPAAVEAASTIWPPSAWI